MRLSYYTLNNIMIFLRVHLTWVFGGLLCGRRIGDCSMDSRLQTLKYVSTIIGKDFLENECVD